MKNEESFLNGNGLCDAQSPSSCRDTFLYLSANESPKGQGVEADRYKNVSLQKDDAQEDGVCILIQSVSDSFDLSSAIDKVSAQRREQAMRYRHEDDRRRSIAAYLLLKEALRRQYGIEENPEFGYHDGGKPFLIGYPGIHFSLSHCRVAVACAVGDAPVGIDIETIRPYKPALARHVLNDMELHEVETSARPDIAFIRLWTMKESYLKMTGEGIRSDLRQVPLHEACFTTEVFEKQGFVCTVCHSPTKPTIPTQPNKPTPTTK